VTSKLPTILLHCLFCLPNPSPQAGSDNSPMLMSQLPNATRLLGVTVMLGMTVMLPLMILPLMMQPLLWRKQMMQRKEGRRGRRGRKLGQRGKTCIYFIFLIFFSFSFLTTCSRKTWADRQHEDKIENAKGTPACLQPCVF